MSGNSPFKRGIIRENDAENCRSRVEFQDEDGTVSYWLSWNMPAAGGAKVFNQPDLNSQVHCLVDHHGEDGCILGASYSKQDKPPTTNGNLTKAVLGSADLEIDKFNGGGTFKFGGPLIFEAPSILIKGPLSIDGESLTHNGKNVGDTHVHTKVLPGPATTGEPA